MQLSNRQLQQLQNAIRLLREIPVGSGPNPLFQALGVCAPVAGGLIGSMAPGLAGSLITHAVGLPDPVLEGWAATPRNQWRQMLVPLLLAAPGALISDRQAITGPFRKQLTLLRVMVEAGLGESAGFKVAQSQFLTLALNHRASFTDAHREMFRLLQPDVAAALARMAVPLLAQEPIGLQIAEAQQLGFLLLSQGRSLVEWNERALQLAREYLPSANIDPDRDWFARFGEWSLSEARPGLPRSVAHRERRAKLDIEVIPLSKTTHAISEDLTLVHLRERTIALPLAELSVEETKVAWLLVTTELTYAEIAKQLGKSKRTVDKQVEAVYRKCAVHSRLELRAKYDLR